MKNSDITPAELAIEIARKLDTVTKMDLVIVNTGRPDEHQRKQLVHIVSTKLGIPHETVEAGMAEYVKRLNKYDPAMFRELYMND